MKKSIIAVAAFALTLSASCGFAAEKIAVVEYDKVVKEYYKTADEIAKLKSIEKEKQEQAQGMIDELNKLKGEYQLLADGKDKKEKEDLIKFKTAELNKFWKNANETMSNANTVMLRSLDQEIRGKIAAMAKDKGYNLILVDKVFVYADESYDITEDVITLINAEKPAEEQK